MDHIVWILANAEHQDSFPAPDILLKHLHPHRSMTLSQADNTEAAAGKK
jgi:hypothetical protein